MAPKTQFYVIGHPIGHSMSPFIHKRLFQIKKFDADYSVYDIPPDKLNGLLPSLLSHAGWINVTIPHKREVLPFLDGLCGRAQLYRSVNTISIDKNGRIGHNTDADGFLCALRLENIPLKGNVAILGCGGVGRTFACEAALAGCSIVNAVRPADLKQADELRNYVLKLRPQTSYTITTLDALDGDFELMINATPVGMYPNTQYMPVNQKAVSRAAAVFDAVYNPAQTELLKCASANGARTLGGMPMLVWQAVVAHEIWHGTKFNTDDIVQLIDDASAEMRRHFA
jgi:shikimate dehydrogenase